MKKLLLAVLALAFATTAASAQIVTGSVPNIFTNGTVADATQVNADYAYIISQVNTNGAKNGTNSDITALTALATPILPTQGGSNIYYAGTATGTANAIVVASPVPANFTLAAGKTIRFIASASNTAAATLAVNGTAATNIYKQTPSGIVALTGGEIIANVVTECYFDGTQYQLMSATAENGGYGVATNLAASATPDIGTVGTHNVNLTGGPFTITSFGSTGTSTYPVYIVKFNATNTLTNSASLALLNGANRVTAAGDVGLYATSGAGTWTEIAYFPTQTKYAPTQANKLTIANNAVTPNTQIDITAAEVVMDNSSGGNYYVENYGTCTINLSTTGAGALDTGAIAASTWYNLYVISTGSTTSCLASVSATTPTMPAGYVYKMRVGAMETDGSSVLYRTKQLGRDAQYTLVAASNTIVYRSIISGASGSCGDPTSTWTATTVQGVTVPATAIAVNAKLTTTGTATAAGPTNVVSPYHAQPLEMNSLVGSMIGRINFDSASLYFCGNGAANYLAAMGWTDSVNAN